MPGQKELALLLIIILSGIGTEVNQYVKINI